ncbi:hypothetical protein Tco_0667102 [Tanacetum coccineum]
MPSPNNLPNNTRNTLLSFDTPPKFSQELTITKTTTIPETTTVIPLGDQVKDKGKKALSHEEVAEEESKSDSNAEVRLTVKFDVAKAEIKKGKDELIDLLGMEVVERMYKDKLKYDKDCLKMLNRRAPGKITNCDVLSRGKCPITLKGSDECLS